jgi:hypothetical protein
MFENVAPRLSIAAALIALATIVAAAQAGPFDSIPLGRGTKVLKQSTVVVPAASSGSDGVIATDIVVTGRGYFGIDFIVQGKKELTLMLVTAAQKSAMESGRRMRGDPLVRIPIDGTASHTANLTPGRYHMYFLNSDSSPTQIVYRTSLQPY